MRIHHPPISDAPCSDCQLRALCSRSYACESFATWCDSERVEGDRQPAREIFVRLFAAEIGVEQLHRHWRREGAKRSTLAQLGQIAPLTRRELGRRYRERLRVIWEIDPQRSAFELERKRLDQRRRERAAAKGLVMSADQVRDLRVRFWLTQAQLAAAIGRKRSSIEHYETGENLAPPRVVKRLRALVRQLAKVPAPPGVSDQAAPAASGYSEGQPL